jgi:hypothetical protein
MEKIKHTCGTPKRVKRLCPKPKKYMSKTKKIYFQNSKVVKNSLSYADSQLVN